MADSANSITAPTFPPPSIILPDTLPDIYGVMVSGNCMAPAYPDGRAIKCSKLEAYQHGDVVVAWFRPELIKPGRSNGMIKRVVMMPPPWVTAFPYRDSPASDVLALVMLGADDRPDEMIRIRCANLLAIHKVVGLVESEEVAPRADLRRSS